MISNEQELKVLHEELSRMNPYYDIEKYKYYEYRIEILKRDIMIERLREVLLKQELSKPLQHVYMIDKDIQSKLDRMEKENKDAVLALEDSMLAIEYFSNKLMRVRVLRNGLVDGTISDTEFVHRLNRIIDKE